MTELNFKELLQVEIDKVQGYVDSKKEAITIAEFNLLKDKNQLTDLEVKLKDLLDKKAELEEFEEWKNSKVKTTKSKKVVDSGEKLGDKPVYKEVEEETKE